MHEQIEVPLNPKCNSRFSHFLDQTVCFQINQQKIIVLNKSSTQLASRKFIKSCFGCALISGRMRKRLSVVPSRSLFLFINKFTNYCNIARNIMIKNLSLSGLAIFFRSSTVSWGSETAEVGTTCGRLCDDLVLMISWMQRVSINIAQDLCCKWWLI